MTLWRIFLDGKLIDVGIFNIDFYENDVLTYLISVNGFNPKITVLKQNE